MQGACCYCRLSTSQKAFPPAALDTCGIATTCSRIHPVTRLLLLAASCWQGWQVGWHVNSRRPPSYSTYAQTNSLKQTLVPHTFFSTLEGYVVNASPFTWMQLSELLNFEQPIHLYPHDLRYTMGPRNKHGDKENTLVMAAPESGRAKPELGR
jgi:hypothetical protein